MLIEIGFKTIKKKKRKKLIILTKSYLCGREALEMFALKVFRMEHIMAEILERELGANIRKKEQ